MEIPTTFRYENKGSTPLKLGVSGLQLILTEDVDEMSKTNIKQWSTNEFGKELVEFHIKEAIDVLGGNNNDLKHHSKYMGYYHAILNVLMQADSLVDAEEYLEGYFGDKWSTIYNDIKADYKPIFKPSLNINPNIYIDLDTGKYKSLIPISRLFGYKFYDGSKFYVSYSYLTSDKEIRPVLLTVKDGELIEVTGNYNIDKAGQELKDAVTLGYANANTDIVRSNNEVDLLTITSHLCGCTAVYKTGNRLTSVTGITEEELAVPYKGELMYLS